jgi:hypothetical protein
MRTQLNTLVKRKTEAAFAKLAKNKQKTVSLTMREDPATIASPMAAPTLTNRVFASEKKMLAFLMLMMRVLDVFFPDPTHKKTMEPQAQKIKARL